MRVLIVEDDAVPRMILKLAVEQCGHECLIAEDGPTAWDMYQNASVEVLISEEVMPGLSGLELCRRVRASPQHASTYFMFLSARDDKTQLMDDFQAGADDFLGKPLDPEELRTRLLVAARIISLHGQLAVQRSELERLNRLLFEQGRRDPLTLLGNRLRLFEDLVIVSGRAARYNQNYAMLLCDLDGFKEYNDHYGFLAGDTILRTIAQTIVKSCRKGDAAYRYSGDKFAILLPNQTEAQARVAAERLRTQVEELQIPHVSLATPDLVSISIGVSELRESDRVNMAQWVKRAEQALYRAKQKGRSSVMAGNPEVN